MIGDGPASGCDRGAVLDRELARGQLGAECPHGRAGRPDEFDPGGLASVWKSGLLGQEPVAGMDGLGSAIMCDLDDAIELEIRLGCSGSADVMSLVAVTAADP